LQLLFLVRREQSVTFGQQISALRRQVSLWLMLMAFDLELAALPGPNWCRWA
jgi:hypothetical protein